MRVTGGLYRSRKLITPAGRTTRPSSDKVREALFSILSPSQNLSGVRLLDLYAGSGSLAIEALSRGAESAVLIESSAQAVQIIDENLSALTLQRRARVICERVEHAAKALRNEQPFDLVLADPPYNTIATRGILPVLEALLLPTLMHAESILVLEHRTGTDVELSSFLRDETRRYGDTSISFYRPMAQTHT